MLNTFKESNTKTGASLIKYYDISLNNQQAYNLLSRASQIIVNKPLTWPVLTEQEKQLIKKGQ